MDYLHVAVLALRYVLPIHQVLLENLVCQTALQVALLVVLVLLDALLFLLHQSFVLTLGYHLAGGLVEHHLHFA